MFSNFFGDDRKYFKFFFDTSFLSSFVSSAKKKKMISIYSYLSLHSLLRINKSIFFFQKAKIILHEKFIINNFF